MKDLESRIDALYKLPLDEFTAARNALAKEAGKDGSGVKQLTKPPVAAWAVNQLYWKGRDDYDALVRAANDMRRTHTAVIEGRKGDLRAASREHDHAIETALKSTLDIMKDRGQPVTDVTRQAILNTLRALPADEPPGRLTRALAPGGFEMLAGVTPAPVKIPKRAPEPKTATGSATERKAAQDAAKQKAAREAAERAVRDAEHHAKRMEFETARAARETAKAEKQLENARAAVERAREALETAERDAKAAERDVEAAVRAQEVADRKARDADSRLRALRSGEAGRST